jgi:type I restriction enzyme S subunit
MRKYDSYKDSGLEWIGEIPKNWECVRLGMLGSFSSSGIDKKLNDDEFPVRMVNFTDLIQSRNYFPVQTGEKDYMKVTTPYSKFLEHKLNKGDMVFIPSSETHEDLGYSSLIDFDEDDVVYSYHILRFRPYREIYHYFKKYLINHHSVLNQFSSEGKGTTRQIIGRNVFNNIRVILPPLFEQQQIVSYLDTKTSMIDSLIEKTQRKIELLKEKRLSLIEKVLFNNGINWIRLQYGVELINRPIERQKQSFNKIGLYNWGRGIFKYDEEIGDELGDSEFSLIKEGDLILSGQFSWEGAIAIVEKEFEDCIASHRFHILRGKKDILITEYIWAYLTSQEGHFILDNNSVGSAGRNRPLNIGKLLKEKIPCPDINTQMEVREIVLIERKFQQYSEKLITLLKEYRQSLISEVVTGKRKVTTDD